MIGVGTGAGANFEEACDGPADGINVGVDDEKGLAGGPTKIVNGSIDEVYVSGRDLYDKGAVRSMAVLTWLETLYWIYTLTIVSP